MKGGQHERMNDYSAAICTCSFPVKMTHFMKSTVKPVNKISQGQEIE